MGVRAGCGNGGDAGGILQLAGLIRAHRAALTFDFRHFFGLSLSDIRRGGVSAQEALDLISELHHERSHFSAAAAGWTRPASTPDLHLQLLTSALGAKVPWPWDGDGPPATPEEIAEAEEVLARYSAIPE